MSQLPSSPVRRIAVIGAGPAGLYAAKSLLEGADQAGLNLRIEFFERRKEPFGLLQYGVAPDHLAYQRVKQVLGLVLQDERVTFHGGREFGRDITREQLCAQFEAVIYAVGAPHDARLEVPGTELQGSVSAGSVVQWYNGHPDVEPLDLSAVRRVTIVGAGNVAFDLVRILAAPPGYLAHTTAPSQVQQALDAKAVGQIDVLIRRGPAEAAFTTPLLNQVAGLAGVRVRVEGTDPAELDRLSQHAPDRRVASNLRALGALLAAQQASAEEDGEPPRCQVSLHFWTRPLSLLGGNGRVRAVHCGHTALIDGRLTTVGASFDLASELVIAAIGFSGVPLPGVPFDPRSGVIPSRSGRVLDGPEGEVLEREYVTGWAKYGAIGIIGSAKSDATAVASLVLADLADPPES